MSENNSAPVKVPTVPAGGPKNPCPPPPVMSPQLLRRLAEASRGPHGGGEQWWVCRFEADPETYSFDLDGPFPTQDAANEMLSGREGYGVFGPYRHSADGEFGVRESPVKIERIRVKISGREEEMEIDPTKFDALFWGAPAVEKFVLPYYTSASGLDYALRVREEFERGNAYLIAHSGDTEHKVFTPKEGKNKSNQLFLSPMT